eukprot:430136_1
MPKLSGKINDTFYKNNQYIYDLTLYNTAISSPISPFICNLTNLKYFIWKNDIINPVQTELPVCFGLNTNKMELVNIQGANIIGYVTSNMCLMTKLQFWGFKNTSLSGTIPVCMHNLVNLIYVSIVANTNIKGEIFNLTSTNLKMIQMHNNSFSGGLSDKFVLSSYPWLQVVTFNNNNFNENDISVLLKKLFLYSSKLQVLSLYGNTKISGTLPHFEHDVYLNQLQILALHDLDIFGTLPSNVYLGYGLNNDNDTNLSSAITLYSNRLSSSIPTNLMDHKNSNIK